VPNVIEIDPYNFEVCRFKFCAFFLRHSVLSDVQALTQGCQNCQHVLLLPQL